MLDVDSGEKTWKNVKVECFSGRCDPVSGNPEPGFADGPKHQARFDSPLGLTVGNDGTVFVADTNNHLVRKITQFGSVTTIAGSARDSTKNSAQARFNYPSDVSLDLNEDAVIVTDRHRIRRVDLNDSTVTTLAGGDIEGDVDGDGPESKLNNPMSITITGDGVAYVSDSASCKIRRISIPSTFAPHISCGDSLASIMRPSGCSSYNKPIDKYGLAATAAEGNIHYNYQFRDQYDVDLGQDFIGRSLKNCVGSPPISLLDKKRWNETTPMYPFNMNLVVDDNVTGFREDPNDGTRITVACSNTCSNKGSFNIFSNPNIFGNGTMHLYSEESSVCAAALSEGILDDNGRGLVDVVIVSAHDLRDHTHNDAGKMQQFFFVLKSSQNEVRLQTISGAPASLLGRSCGYKDSFPPESSKVS